jgi:DNA-binding CsgD family transcriptional regulator
MGVNQDETRNHRTHAQASEKRMERKIVELLKSGKSQNEIVKILGVGDRRVRRIRKMAETY